MFGHKAEPSRIYRYRALLPTQGIEAIEEQLRLAHHYRNRLVDLEHRRRRGIHDVLQRAMPTGAAWVATVEMLEAALDTHRRVLARQHATLRRREISATAKQVAHELKQARREARQHLRALRHIATGKGLDADDLTHQAVHRCHLQAHDATQELAHVEAAINEERKQWRAQSGLYWASYLAVEAGMQAARSGPPPRFRRYDLTGKLAVQLQHGLSPEEVYSMQDPRLQLEPATLNEHGKVPRRERLKRCRFRVGSVGREPLWAELPVLLSRPLPEDGQVKWAYLKRERIATHYYWYVEFVVSRPGGWPKRDAAKQGMVGLDPGYRRKPQGLRVLYWVGDDHDDGEVVLPEWLLQRWVWVFELQAIRQHRFNATLAELVAWVKVQGRPDWWPEATKSLAQWRSPGRLAALVLLWRREHADEAQDLLQRLEAWRRLDKRRYEEQEHLRRHLIDARDAIYREAALMLRRRYRTAVIEDADWDDMAKREEAEEVRRLPAIVGRYRQIAAPSRLVQILQESFAEPLSGPAGYSTQRCAVCGQLMGITRQDGRYMPVDTRSLEIWCRWCRTTHDQDRNAARNFVNAAPILSARAGR